MSASGAQPNARVDLRLVLERTWAWLPPVIFIAAFVWRASFFVAHPYALGGDGVLYYRATEAWVAGGDPWAAADDYGVRYAAPPPALLLSLPLLPLGEHGATIFWWVTGIASMVFAVRRYRLELWWLLFPPFIEGLGPASPDLALLGMVLVGGGALSAATKPYAAPAMLAEGRWRAVLLGGCLVALTLLVLPWAPYLEGWSEISQTLARQSNTGGLPPWAWIVAAVATASLGRRGLAIAVPVLLPGAQPHYAVFSVAAIRTSRWLMLGFALPGALPLAVVALAAHEAVAHVRARPRHGGGDP